MTTRKRNPRAPLLNLQDAIKFGLDIYEGAGLHPIPIDAAAEAIGYKDSRNGAAQQRLATLKQYGILQKEGKANIAVSKEIQTLKFAPSDEERFKAAEVLFKTPSVYQSLLDKYNNAPPNDKILRFDLINMGFSPDGAEAVLKCFSESYDYIKNIKKDEEILLPKIDDMPNQNENNGDILESNPDQEQSTKLNHKENTDYPTSEIQNLLFRLPHKRTANLSIPADFSEKDKIALLEQVKTIWIDEE